MNTCPLKLRLIWRIYQDTIADHQTRAAAPNGILPVPVARRLTTEACVCICTTQVSNGQRSPGTQSHCGMPKVGKMRGKMPHKPGADLSSLNLHQKTCEMSDSTSDQLQAMFSQRECPLFKTGFLGQWVVCYAEASTLAAKSRFVNEPCRDYHWGKHASFVSA